MATYNEREIYRRIVNLILEEVEGCGLKSEDWEHGEFMKVVEEFNRRIIESPQDTNQHPFKRPFTNYRKPTPQGHNAKRREIKAKLASSPLMAPPTKDLTVKPPWFDPD